MIYCFRQEVIITSEINERWKNARLELGYKQGQLSEILSMPQSTLSGYEKSVNIPSSSVRAFASICGVRESYLLNGDLPILEPPKEQTPVEKIVEQLNLPPIFATAMEEWLLLPEDQQRAIVELSERIVARHAAKHPPDDPK